MINAGFAQQFGGHPVSQRWKQVNTDSIRIIFPPGLEKQAMEIADIHRVLPAQTGGTIGGRMRKISIVLQHRTISSNGYVGLGPWRSEFYLTPLQNNFSLGSLPWHKSLALHELRHVQQYSNFRKGISRVAHAIFGEQVEALVNSAAVPDYFWEGDAVYQETLMSQQGRGRIPFFYNGYRSLWAADKEYSWQKLRNGSLRDYVPDHYQLGYLLVAYGRKQFGDSIWAKITNDAVRYRGLFYPWQRAIKRHTGLTYQLFRANALADAQAGLSSGDTMESLAVIAEEHKHFAGDQLFPVWISDDEVLMVESDYRNIPAFVVRNIKTNTRLIVRQRDIAPDQYYSYRNNKIVYAAYAPDLRWGWRDYSGIRLVDLRSGRQRTITAKTRYFSPDISPDGEKIVTVHATADSNALHVLQVNGNGAVHIVPNPGKLVFTYPKFIDDANVITAARNGLGEMALIRLRLADGEVENLTPWSTHVIGYPLVQGDAITFTASENGSDALFVFKEDQLYRLNTSKQNGSTGNYQVSIRNDQYCWSAFSAVGYRLLTAPASDVIAEQTDNKILLQPLVAYGNPEGLDLVNNTSKGEYAITPYKQSFRLINPHSFRPYFNDPDYTFSLISENVLNNFVSEAYFNYNSNEKSKEFGLNANYGALFPWVRGGVNYTFDRSARFSGRRVYWNEAEANIGLLVPLNLTGGRFYRRLNVSADYVFNKRDLQGEYKDSFDNRAFGYLRTAINFSNQVQQARQHIYPRLAQTVSLNYSRSISSLEASQFLASAYWYLPGLAKTHNLVLNTAFHARDTLRNAGFSNSFPFSRGYIAENYHHMFKLGVNYHLPLVYPDFGIASIVYFQRVRINLFYDFTRINDFAVNGRFIAGNFRSTGAELFFDTRWWNQQPASFGIRYSYLLDAETQNASPHQWGFILPLDLLAR